MTRATAHQPVYMPWLGLIHKIASADMFVSWDAVQMEDSGYENRQIIKGGGWLTVPVHRGRDLLIKDVTIANEHGWQRKHFRAIEQAYAKAPHWNDYLPVLRHIFGDTRWTTLAELNQWILDYLCVKFELQPKMRRLSHLETTTHRNEQIIEACRAVNARSYVFGSQGRGYVNLDLFRAAGIEPLVQDYDPVPYDQGKGVDAFEPRLWAFDVLMYNDADVARDIMLAGGKVSRMAE